MPAPVSHPPHKKTAKILLLVLGSVLGLVLVSAVILVLNFPSMAAPTTPIPAADPAATQTYLQNLNTKLSSSLVQILTSRDGRLRLTISDRELNALIYQTLSQNLNQDVKLLGSRTVIAAQQNITTDLAVKWQGYTLGLHTVFAPRVLPNGQLLLTIEQLKLGKIPLPRQYLLTYLKPDLPQGVTLSPQPYSLLIDPNGFLPGTYPPIIKDPRVYFEALVLGNDFVGLVARISFRLLW